MASTRNLHPTAYISQGKLAAIPDRPGHNPVA